MRLVASIRQEAASRGAGYAVLLFNLNKNSAIQPTVTIANAQRTSFDATKIVYGKNQYDDSKNNVWTGPVTKNLGTLKSTFTINLPPWSMTVVKLQ